jgi:hypothetical protein
MNGPDVGQQEKQGVPRATVSAARRAERVVTPDGAEWAPRLRIENVMLKAGAEVPVAEDVG